MESLVDACEILLQFKKKKNLTAKSRKEKRKTSQKLARKQNKTGFHIPQPIKKIPHAASKIQAAPSKKFTKNNIYYRLYILKHLETLKKMPRTLQLLVSMFQCAK